MRSSRRQAEINRERVVATAAKMFRERGIDNVSIADVMKAVDLTHGGFYKQFASKGALAREACALGLANSVALIPKLANGTGRAALRRVIVRYLSPDRLEPSMASCTLAALASDASRGDGELQGIFADGITRMAELLGEVEERPEHPEGQGAGRTLPDFALMASMIGAMVLARAVHSADPKLATQILDDVVRQVAPAVEGAPEPAP